MKWKMHTEDRKVKFWTKRIVDAADRMSVGTKERRKTKKLYVNYISETVDEVSIGKAAWYAPYDMR